MPRAAKPAETTLDDNVEELSTVAPGDAPADTTDPTGTPPPSSHSPPRRR